VSIYLPTGRSTLEAQAARTMLSNSRRDVGTRLESAIVGDGDRSSVLDELDSIIDDDGF
jgi:hypothetical protein